MVRTVKTAPVRQDEILDVAERLFLQKGYDDTPIQAIIEAVGIAKGTFYHHYPSKTALLDALIARYTERAFAIANAIVADPELDALTKLHRVFSRTGAWKAEQRTLLIELHRAMHQPANAAMYARMMKDGFATTIPLATRVIEQGVREGVFRTRWPEQTARYVMEISASVSMRVGDALLGSEHPTMTREQLRVEIEACHAVLAKVLDVPVDQIHLLDFDQLSLWLPESNPPRPQ